MPNFPVTASDTGLSISESIAKRLTTRITDTGVTVTTSLSRLASRAQPTTTGLTITDSIRVSVGRSVADTGLSISDSLARYHPIALTDFVFAGPFAAGTSVLDNFLRANETPLSGGGRWTRTGTFGSNLNLVSHATVASTFSQIDSESYVAAGDLTDCEVWATLAQIPATGGGIFDTAGVILRQNPATVSQKDCYVLAYETNGTHLFLTYTDASGTTTSLGSWTVALSNGDSIGLRALGTTFTAYYKHGAGAWTVAGSVTDASGSHGYIGLQQLAAGVSSQITNFGGGPVGVHDSIAPLLAPHGLFPDTGLTISDFISVHKSRSLSDTGLTITDAMVVFLNGDAFVSLTDTGLTLSDAIQKSVSKLLADTGLTVTDSASSGPIRRALIVDTGLTFSDSFVKSVLKHISDTGLTVSDSPGRSHPVAITTTGLTVTDSIKAAATRPVTDTGLTITTTLVAIKNGHNPSVNISDIGLRIGDTLSDTEHYFRAVGTFAPDTGLTLSDGLIVTVNGGPPNSCDSDFLRFLMDLEASSEYTAWCAANPIDCGTWTEYANAIINGGTPSPPTMTDDFGTALVDAGIIALDGIVPCRDRPPPRTSPFAAFTPVVSGLGVAFMNESLPGASGVFASWLWTFGDGNTETSIWSPHHTYASAGTYTVTLTVVGGGRDGTSSVSHPVTVFVPGVVGFHIDAVIV